MKHIYKILFIIATILLLQSCDEPAVKDERKERIIKIAVVLTDDSRDRWDRIINLAQNNIRHATDVHPVIEFYDEDSYDMMTLAYDLARDESIVCVIGCESKPTPMSSHIRCPDSSILSPCSLSTLLRR